jgi:hypothetical protein
MPQKLNPMCQIPEELLPPACISLAGNAIDWADDADAHVLATVPVTPKTLRAMAEQLRRIPELEAELTRWQTELVKSQALVDALRAQGARVPDGWQSVPKRATKEMIEAGIQQLRTYMQYSDGYSPAECWAHMLSSAPTAPQVEPASEAFEAMSKTAHEWGRPTVPQMGEGPTEIIKALRESAQSLETIFMGAGKYETLKTMQCVRMYAGSRARVAGDVLSTTQPTDTPQSAPSAQGGL